MQLVKGYLCKCFHSCTIWVGRPDKIHYHSSFQFKGCDMLEMRGGPKMHRCHYYATSCERFPSGSLLCERSDDCALRDRDKFEQCQLFNSEQLSHRAPNLTFGEAVRSIRTESGGNTKRPHRSHHAWIGIGYPGE